MSVRSLLFFLFCFLFGISGCRPTGTSSANQSQGHLYAGFSGGWSAFIGTDKTFSASNTTLGVSIAGTYSRLESGFLKMTVQSSTGTNGSFPVGTAIYGLDIPGWMFVAQTSPVAHSKNGVFAADTIATCSDSDLSLHWTFTQWPSGMKIATFGTPVAGTFHWDHQKSTATLSSTYDLSGASISSLSGVSGIAGSCSNGTYSFPATSNFPQASFYLARSGGGFFSSDSGVDGIAVSTTTLTSAKEFSRNWSGFVFTASSGNDQSIWPIRATISASGQVSARGVSSVDLINDDPSTILAEATIDVMDQPEPGFFKASVKSHGSLIGTALCESDGTVIVCSGTGTSDSDSPFNVIMTPQSD
jgi:hypothetical protein